MNFLGGWESLGFVLLAFGFAPGAVLRIAVRAYPRDHPRRRELLAELYAMRYVERPLFVAQQLETAVFEGVPARWNQRRLATVSLVERFDEWRRRLIVLPDDVSSHLSDEEFVVYSDHPSLRAFFLKKGGTVLGLVAAMVVTAIALSMELIWLAAMLLVATMVGVAKLVLDRKRDRAATAVVTNMRLIQIPGGAARPVISKPWAALTGVGYRQRPLGRVIGYATVAVAFDSDEAEPFESLYQVSDLNDPAAFHQHILDVVSGAHTTHRRPGTRLELWPLPRRLIECGHKFLRSPAEWRRHYLPLPDEVVHEYLGEDEHLVQNNYQSCRPQLTRTVVDACLWTAAATLSVVTIAGLTWAAVGLWICAEIAIVRRSLRSLAGFYTGYATTNQRLLRISGVCGRKVMSAPWGHLKAITYTPSPADQPSQPATIRIVAGEGIWGTQEFADIPDPETFHKHLLQMMPITTPGLGSQREPLRSTVTLLSSRGSVAGESGAAAVEL